MDESSFGAVHWGMHSSVAVASHSLASLSKATRDSVGA